MRGTPWTFRHTRPAIAAIGLERRLPDRPERLPSDHPVPCGPSGSAVRVVHSRRLAPHPFARIEPVPPRQGWRGRLELPRTLRGGLAAATWRPGKMRFTDFCNRLSSRAPFGSLDSWVRTGPRLVLRRLAIRYADSPWAGALRRLGMGARRFACRMSLPSGASLDGEPPASANAATTA